MASAARPSWAFAFTFAPAAIRTLTAVRLLALSHQRQRRVAVPVLRVHVRACGDKGLHAVQVLFADAVSSSPATKVSAVSPS